VNSPRGIAVKPGVRQLAAAFALSALLAPAAAAQETEHLTRTLAQQPGGTLRLKSFSGRVTITGTDANEVVVDAVRRAPRDRLDRIKLDVHAEGSTVVVDANRREGSWWMSHDNVVETDFDIKVPRQTNINVDVFSAPVTIQGVEGSHRLHGFSTRIRLVDVAGSVQAHTFSGDVDVQERRWQDGQSIDIDTFSGNVKIRVPDEARGTVTFNSFSGQFNAEVPLTLRSSGRRSVTAQLGGGGSGSLRFKTFSGSVSIGR
jgi:putative adhesin